MLFRSRTVDCIVINPQTSGLSPVDFVRQAHERFPDLAVPILVYDHGNETGGVDGAWKQVAKNPAIHWVHSLERLLDQTTLCLHREAASLPNTQRRILEDMYESNKLLSGRRILIVDDDVRNIFALSSVVEEYGMLVASADNGQDAIRLVQSENDVDIVLMDIMMPEMDGLDTTREIRKIPGRKNLPIIAVTAKAMKGDRDRCLEAGAWDYLSKPVDTAHLLATLRRWLQR